MFYSARDLSPELFFTFPFTGCAAVLLSISGWMDRLMIAGWLLVFTEKWMIGFNDVRKRPFDVKSLNVSFFQGFC